MGGLFPIGHRAAAVPERHRIGSGTEWSTRAAYVLTAAGDIRAAMTLDELMSIVEGSKREDWSSVGTVDAGRTTWRVIHRENVAIGVEWGGGELVEHPGDWATVFEDKRVFRYQVTVLYSGAPVHREDLFAVDGGRSFLPTAPLVTPAEVRDDGTGHRVIVPTSRVSEPADIPRASYRLAALVNSLTGRADFDRYFRHAGLRVAE